MTLDICGCKIIREYVSLLQSYLIASFDVVSLYPTIHAQNVHKRRNNCSDHMENINENVMLYPRALLILDLIIITSISITKSTEKIMQHQQFLPHQDYSLNLYYLKTIYKLVYCPFPHTWIRYLDDIFIICQHAVALINNF